MDFTKVTEGDLLWEPSDEFKGKANITQFLQFLLTNKKLSFDSYDDLWKWSVTNLEDFWVSIWN